MPIHIEAYDDTTILYTIEQRWTLDELEEAQPTLNRMVIEMAANHPVTLIVDYTNGGPPPARLISEFARLVRHDVTMHLGKIISVNGEHGVIGAAGRIFSRVFKQVEFANSLDEALSMAAVTQNE